MSQATFYSQTIRTIRFRYSASVEVRTTSRTTARDGALINAVWSGVRTGLELELGTRNVCAAYVLAV